MVEAEAKQIARLAFHRDYLQGDHVDFFIDFICARSDNLLLLNKLETHLVEYGFTVSTLEDQLMIERTPRPAPKWVNAEHIFRCVDMEGNLDLLHASLVVYNSSDAPFRLNEPQLRVTYMT